jgi:hypothetical protein
MGAASTHRLRHKIRCQRLSLIGPSQTEFMCVPGDPTGSHRGFGEKPLDSRLSLLFASWNRRIHSFKFLYRIPLFQ